MCFKGFLLTILIIFSYIEGSSSIEISFLIKILQVLMGTCLFLASTSYLDYFGKGFLLLYFILFKHYQFCFYSRIYEDFNSFIFWLVLSTSYMTFNTLIILAYILSQYDAYRTQLTSDHFSNLISEVSFIIHPETHYLKMLFFVFLRVFAQSSWTSYIYCN